MLVSAASERGAVKPRSLTFIRCEVRAFPGAEKSVSVRSLGLQLDKFSRQNYQDQTALVVYYVFKTSAAGRVSAQNLSLMIV